VQIFSPTTWSNPPPHTSPQSIQLFEVIRAVVVKIAVSCAGTNISEVHVTSIFRIVVSTVGEYYCMDRFLVLYVKGGRSDNMSLSSVPIGPNQAPLSLHGSVRPTHIYIYIYIYICSLK
jgi:hypothetical protein